MENQNGGNTYFHFGWETWNVWLQKIWFDLWIFSYLICETFLVSSLIKFDLWIFLWDYCQTSADNQLCANLPDNFTSTSLSKESRFDDLQRFLDDLKLCLPLGQCAQLQYLFLWPFSAHVWTLGNTSGIHGVTSKSCNGPINKFMFQRTHILYDSEVKSKEDKNH